MPFLGNLLFGIPKNMTQPDHWTPWSFFHPCPDRYKMPRTTVFEAARVEIWIKETILIARKSSSSTSCCGKSTRIGWTGATQSGAPMKSHALHWRMIVRGPNQPIYRGCKTNRTQLVTLTTKGSQAHMSRLSLTVKDMWLNMSIKKQPQTYFEEEFLGLVDVAYLSESLFQGSFPKIRNHRGTGFDLLVYAIKVRQMPRIEIFNSKSWIWSQVSGAAGYMS